MTAFSPTEVAPQLGSGLLSFPVTHFTDDLRFDETAYRQNIAWLAQYDASGLFAAGGTGEFFSLTFDEVEQVVTAAVKETPAELPVVAPAGYGTALAVDLARAAERAGADAILLLPHYLSEAGQAGLEAHVRAVCRSTDLGVIIYNRANARYDADDRRAAGRRLPEPDRLQGRRRRHRADDADLLAAGRSAALRRWPAHRRAVRAAVPEAGSDHLLLGDLQLPAAPGRWTSTPRSRGGDDAHVFAALNEFVLPYCDLRNRTPGYAVSIVKAGMKVIGRPAGPVRPPLTDLDRGRAGRAGRPRREGRLTCRP